MHPSVGRMALLDGQMVAVCYVQWGMLHQGERVNM